MPVDIKKPLKKFLPFLLEAREKNLNEADTVQRLIKVFEEVLGYDAMTEISREAQMKGKFVDVVLRIDDVIRLLVEAKAAAEKLRDRHIDQAETYAVKNHYPWVLLTNGVEWNLYHLTFGDDGVESQAAFRIDLSKAEDLDIAADKLSLLHKQAIKKGELERFWEKNTALNPASIGKALFLEDVLLIIRREIKRDTGVLIDPEDLAASLYKMLSDEARVLIGALKIRKRRAVTKRTGQEAGAEQPSAESPGDGEEREPAETQDVQEVAPEQPPAKPPQAPPSMPS